MNDNEITLSKSFTEKIIKGDEHPENALEYALASNIPFQTISIEGTYNQITRRLRLSNFQNLSDDQIRNFEISTDEILTPILPPHLTKKYD